MGDVLIPNAQLLALAAMLLGAWLLDSQEIRLPRGDAVSMAGPLVAATTALFGVGSALGVGLSSLVISSLTTTRDEPSILLSSIIVRTASTLAAGSALVAVQGLGMDASANAVVAPMTYLATELVAQQMAASIGSDRSLAGLLRGSAGRQAPIVAAEMSAAALVIVTHPGMGPWALIPVVALLMLIRQSWAMLLTIRDTYRTTMIVLVDAAVAQNPALEGHAERSAAIARTVGARMGVKPRDLERLSYAALLHDIDGINNESCPTGSVGVEATHGASEVVRDVVFLKDVIPLLRVSDGHTDTTDDTTLLLGLLVLLASCADAVNHPSVVRPLDTELVRRVSAEVPRRLKSKAAAAALELGYQLPAMS